MALGGQVADGTIIAAALIAGRVLYPMAGLVDVWKDLKRGRLAVTRLRDYLRRDVEYPSGADTEDPDARGQIRFFNVSKFAPRTAPNREPREILSGFSFAIQPGDGLAVIGSSGAGKTALAIELCQHLKTEISFLPGFGIRTGGRCGLMASRLGIGTTKHWGRRLGICRKVRG